MTSREPNGASSHSYWLEQFFNDHPDGGLTEFESWAPGIEGLRAKPNALEEARAELRAWLEPGAEAMPPNRGSTHQSAFRQRAGRAESDSSSGPYRALHEGLSVGPFTLRRFIDRGGMGQVWEAEDTELRRAVALKLVLPDRVDARSLDLFAREARAGGRLQHPNIVTTLAYGTDEGLSWIAQELIHGSWTVKDSIEALRSDDRLPRDYYRQVAELVAKIADGLQAAHDTGVIHRDIKPQNILIDGSDEPKVTDFGLARVVGDSFQSRPGAGTPAYMSPEQILGNQTRLDHRTDVFSLGVVLYELLTLRRPFEGDTPEQVAREILSTDPPAADRVRSQCPGELAAVAGKALEKIPDGRYATMADLAADLRRHLAGEPTVAQRPGITTRGLKWIRRHPAVSTTIAIGAGALSLVTTMAINLAAEVEENANLLVLAQERGELATRRAEETARISAFQQERLSSVDPALMGLRLRDGLAELVVEQCRRHGLDEQEITEAVNTHGQLMEGLDLTGLALDSLKVVYFLPVLDAVERDFADQPLLQARLRQVLASTLRSLGLLELAVTPQEQALRARRGTLGEDSIDSLESMANLARLLVARGELESGEALHRQTLNAQRRLLGDDHPHTIESSRELGATLRLLGKLSEAEVHLTSSLDSHRRIYGDADERTLSAMNSLATLLSAMDRKEEAGELLAEALRAASADPHVDSFLAVQLRMNLGSLHLGRGRRAEAEPLLRGALEACRQLLGFDHPDTLLVAGQLGVLLTGRRKSDEAVRLLRDTLERKRRVQGRTSIGTLISANDLAMAYKELGEVDLAEGSFLEALSGLREQVGNSDSRTLSIQANFAHFLFGVGRLAEAEHQLTSLLDISVEAHGMESYDTIATLAELSTVIHAQGRVGEAEAMMREALEVQAMRTSVPDHLSKVLVANLGALVGNRGDLEEAEGLLRESLEICRRLFGDSDPETQEAVRGLARLLLDRDKYTDAEPLLLESLPWCYEQFGYEHETTVDTLHRLVHLLVQVKREGDASDLLADFLKAASLSPEHPLLDEVEQLRSEIQAK